MSEEKLGSVKWWVVSRDRRMMYMFRSKVEARNKCEKLNKEIKGRDKSTKSDSM